MYGSHFGLGFVSATPVGGSTPIPFGLLKGVKLDYDEKLVELRGGFAYPVAVGRGEASLGGSIEEASFFGAAMASILGGSAVAGATAGVPSEIAAIPATPFAVTVENSATFAADYGVLDLTTGLMMAKVGSNPTTGQYSVADGVYTFAEADSTHRVSIAYSYTIAAGGKKTTTVANRMVGLSVGYELVAFGPGTSGNVLGVKLFAAHFSKLGLQLQVNDFAAKNLEFICSQGATGLVMDLYTGE
jgi:hypothetical protein